MIRYLIHRPTTDGKVYAVIAGLSTDAKPTTGLITGSRFVAADTGARYMFDESAGQWNETQFQDQIDAAVQAWLDDHPEAIDQAAIEALFGDQLDGIEEDLGGLKSAISNITFHGIDFTVNANSSHSSTKDQIPVYVKAGEKFVILCDQGIHGVYAYYADGTSETVQEKGIASKEIIAFGKYLNNATESNVRCRLIVVTNPYGVDILENLDYANLLKELTLGKNIVGSEQGVYYPVYIPAGTTFTMSTSDGSAIQSDLRLHMYNSNKVELSDWWTFRSGTSEKTVTQTVALGTAYYMKWETNPPVPIQVEISPSKTAYEPYIGVTKLNFELIQKLNNEIISTKNIIGLDNTLYYPAEVPVGAKITMSTQDRQPIGQYGLNLEGYDENLDFIGSWNFNPAMTKRTITWTIKKAHYLKWSSIPNKNVQVEYGSDATNYKPYALNVQNTEIIKNILSGGNVLENTFVSDYNSKPAEEYAQSVNEIILDTDGNTEQFMFFTDPHMAIQSGGDFGMIANTNEHINFMEAVYNISPMSFIMCGGDWLGNGDTPDIAASKLTYIDGFMRKKFKNYIPINGNHDTNYQGKETASSAIGTGQIDNKILKDFTQKFREEQKMYYRYDAQTSRIYIFDTGTESEAISTYQNEQLEWFANALDSDNTPHIIIALHIVYPSEVGGTVQPITDKILQIAQAYNSRGTISVNGTSHNYGSATGKVSFCISGHTHSDYATTINNIPCFITTRTIVNGICTFDLCIADWTAKKLKAIRVGSGSNREIDIL